MHRLPTAPHQVAIRIINRHPRRSQVTIHMRHNTMGRRQGSTHLLELTSIRLLVQVILHLHLILLQLRPPIHHRLGIHHRIMLHMAMLMARLQRAHRLAELHHLWILTTRRTTVSMGRRLATGLHRLATRRPHMELRRLPTAIPHRLATAPHLDMVPHQVMVPRLAMARRPEDHHQGVTATALAIGAVATAIETTGAETATETTGVARAKAKTTGEATVRTTRGRRTTTKKAARIRRTIRQTIPRID